MRDTAVSALQVKIKENKLGGRVGERREGKIREVAVKDRSMGENDCTTCSTCVLRAGFRREIERVVVMDRGKFSK